jgi:hypothetical protein
LDEILLVVAFWRHARPLVGLHSRSIEIERCSFRAGMFAVLIWIFDCG